MSLRPCSKCLIVFVFLAGLASPSLFAQYAKAPDAYSVTEINSMFGPTSTMEVWRDGNRAVLDQSYLSAGASSGGHTRQIFDLKAGKSYSLDLSQAGGQCSAGNISGDWGDPFATTAELTKLNAKEVGTDTVLGMAAKVLEVVLPGQQGTSKVWVDARYGLILKMVMGGKTVIEVKKVSFAKPPASELAMPAACAGVVAPPTEEEKIAADLGGNVADFANAVRAPATPSSNSCTVLFRVVHTGSMAPVTSGFQVAVDKTVDVNHPAAYKMGSGPGGRATFSGGGLKELTSQLRNGVLRIDDAPAQFDMEIGFANGGFTSALIYRQCFGPETVLMHVVNPENTSDGTHWWVWVKSGKYAHVAANAVNGGGTSRAPTNQVDLSAAYNRVGIYRDGNAFTAGGLDGGGWAYSASLLGSTATWNGAPFAFGPANSPDAVSSSGQTVALPSGNFSSLRLLGTALNGNQASQVFTVTYADGSSSSFTQNLSDWFSPQGYRGEAKAVSMPYRNVSNGVRDARTFFLYGYTFPLDSSKTVTSITLPNNGNVEVLALTLMSPG